MANPLLNDRSMQNAVTREEGQAGWAAPAGQAPGTLAPPAAPDTVTRWDGGIMTVSGTASATLTLLLLLLASATVSWFLVAAPAADGTIQLPAPWIFGGLIVGFISALVPAFSPRLSRVAAPVYAIAEGVVIGAISRAFEVAYNGIVLQAVGATLGVFLVVLLMYRSGVVKVNVRYQRIVTGAMGGLFLFYMVSLLMGIFGAMPSFINDASPMGILFSVFVAGLAAANLAIDFDTIERGAQNKLPAYMEWYCALGVTITLVWLYLEILRLIAKLRDN